MQSEFSYNVSQRMTLVSYKPTIPTAGDKWMMEYEHALLLSFLKQLDEQDLTLSNTKLKSEDRKWLAISGVQKAIRRGEKYLAIRYASALYNRGQKEHLWRRLAIISLEDVALGNPLAVELTLFFAKNWKGIKESADEKKAIAWCITALCSGPKTRALTKLMIMAQSKWNPDVQLIADCRLHMAQGKMDFHTSVMTEPKFTPQHRYAMLVGKRMSLDCLYAAMLPIAQALVSEDCLVDQDPVTDEMIGPWLASTFDHYTQIGKRAMMVTLKKDEPLKAWLEKKGKWDDRIKLYGRSVFALSSGVVAQNLMSPTLFEIADAYVEWSAQDAGVSLEEWSEFVELTKAAMPVLNHWRRYCADEK